ncbi:sirohydrochlorin nickelochelatase [Methanobrevibacter cuticularis]
MDSNNLKTSSRPKDNFGVLLISHGSSLDYASKTFKEIVTKYIETTGHKTEVGYMKVAEPSISKAIDNLTKDGDIDRIIAMPVFLAQGIHTNIDIPLMLGLSPLETDPRCPEGNYPPDHYLNDLNPINFDGEINLINCIGADSSILNIIDKRVNSAIETSKIKTTDQKTGIILVSHGSRLNYNREFITDIFNQYIITNDYVVGQGFMELSEPSIPQAINKIIKNNEIDRLVVVPVFIAPGVHTTRDIPTILGLLEDNEKKDSHNHSHSNNHTHSHSHTHDHSHAREEIEFNGEILYTEPLGADSLIIEIIKERIENEIK